MNIETSLPISEVRRRLEAVIQTPRLPIPFIRRPARGLVGNIEEDQFELKAFDLWRGRFRVRGVVTGDDRGASIDLDAQGLGGRLRMITPLAATVCALVIATFYAVKVGPDASEHSMFMFGLVGVLIIMTIVAAYFATLPVLRGKDVELAQAVAAVVDGRLKVFDAPRHAS